MTCEKCWDAAFWEAAARGGSQADHYREIVRRRDALGLVCSPREQAGRYWDEAQARDARSAAVTEAKW